MLLADLDLSVLSSEVIESLILGLQRELAYRRALRKLPKAKQHLPKFHKVQERFGFPTYEEELARLATLYSSDLYALPTNVRYQKINPRLQYLPIVLAQDWTLLFPHAKTDMQEYYVYAHLDPRQSPITLASLDCVLAGHPFYIGKGSGQRAWDLKRNQGHGKRIARIRSLGYSDSALVTLIANRLTEQEALILEAKLIYFFGSIYDDSAKGCLLNLADHIRPIFVWAMNRLPDESSYGQDLQYKATETYRIQIQPKRQKKGA